MHDVHRLAALVLRYHLLQGGAPSVVLEWGAAQDLLGISGPDDRAVAAVFAWLPSDITARLVPSGIEVVKRGCNGDLFGGVTPQTTEQQRVAEVFAYWCQRTKRPKTTRLTANRARKVRARLRDGYSVEQLKRAIDGIASSPFHNGDNDTGGTYTELELVCRNGSNVERFASLARKHARPAPQSAAHEALRRAFTGR